MAYYTKNNRPIAIKRIEHMEPPQENRGWVVHGCVAFVDGEPAGYIKISYIPKEKFEKLYPDVLHYLANINGWCNLRAALETKDIDSILHALDRTYKYPIADGQDFEWKLSKISELTNNLKHSHQKDFEGFKEFHMDKPLVDFIRVYNEHEEYMLNERGESVPREKIIDFQRQGVGLALYQEAATWMAEKGLCLYASGCQQPCAAAVWDLLAAQGMTKVYTPKSKTKAHRKPRRYLDFNKPKLELSI